MTLPRRGWFGERVENAPTTSVELTQYVRERYELWGRRVKELGIQQE